MQRGNVFRLSIVFINVLLEKWQISVCHRSSRGAKQDRIKTHGLWKPLPCYCWACSLLLLYVFVSECQRGPSLSPFLSSPLIGPAPSVVMFEAYFRVIGRMGGNPVQLALCSCMAFPSLPLLYIIPLFCFFTPCFGPQAQQPVCQVCLCLLRSFCFQIELEADYHPE